jgi:hypothetical protein
VGVEEWRGLPYAFGLKWAIDVLSVLVLVLVLALDAAARRRVLLTVCQSPSLAEVCEERARRTPPDVLEPLSISALERMLDVRWEDVVVEDESSRLRVPMEDCTSSCGSQHWLFNLLLASKHSHHETTM